MTKEDFVVKLALRVKARNASYVVSSFMCYG